MLLVGLLYGTNYSIVKIITPEYILPFGLIVIRVAIATACFWLIGLSVNEKINWRADWVRIVLCAFFGVGINMLFFFKGVSLTTAINGSIIMTLTPVMVFVTSLIMLKEKVTLLKVLGLAVGFLGAFLIIYSPGTGISLGNWRGGCAHSPQCHELRCLLSPGEATHGQVYAHYGSQMDLFLRLFTGAPGWLE